MLDGKYKYKLNGEVDPLIRKDGKWYWQEGEELQESAWKDDFWEREFVAGRLSRMEEEIEDYIEYPSNGTLVPEKAIIGDPVVIPVQEEEIYASTVGAEIPETTVKEEIMKKETVVSVAKFCGNLALRGLNYWVATPAMNIARPIVSSVRYVVFVSTLAGIVYGYNRPDVVKNVIKSCIPKITIEAPEILK